MTAPQFVDISGWNPTSIDWQAYKKWSAQGDGVSRVAIKSSEGTSVDGVYPTHRAHAEQAGIDQIMYYHYARPQWNSAVAEANTQTFALGKIRANDSIALDFEEDNPNATAQWALDFLNAQHNRHAKVAIYSYYSMILAHLQDVRLRQFSLWYARWTYNPDVLPACPLPWLRYDFLQYSDSASIPGIPGLVDADIFLGVPVDNQIIPAHAIWQSVIPNLSFSTGISAWWLAEYRKNIFHGAPLSAEIHTMDWSGQPNIVQIFAGGQVEWQNGNATWHPYQ